MATFSHSRTPLRTRDRTLGLSRAFWTVSTSFPCRKDIHLKRHVLIRKHSFPAFSMCPMSLNLKVKLWQPHLHCSSAVEFHESPSTVGRCSEFSLGLLIAHIAPPIHQAPALLYKIKTVLHSTRNHVWLLLPVFLGRIALPLGVFCL